MILISACLAGVNCKYNGKNNFDKTILDLISSEKVVLICPEQLGGCPTPRDTAEISGGTGADVLDNKANVLTKSGINITDKFIKGANESLKIAKMFNCNKAILKARSPSCGCGSIYSGTFSMEFIVGNGVTAELLLRNGIQIYTEEDIF